MEKNFVIHSDGGSRGNPGPGACAFTIEQNGKLISKGSKYLGEVTNNFAEYSGVLLALRQCPKNSNIVFYSDSELMVKQLCSIYKIKNMSLKEIANKIRSLMLTNNLRVEFVHILRFRNKLADALVNKELDEKVSENVV